MLEWIALNPATAFWAGLGLVALVAAGGGAVCSPTFRQSCSEFAAAATREMKDLARAVGYVVAAPFWMVWKIQRMCRWLQPRLERFEMYRTMDQHRLAIGVAGIAVVAGFVWATGVVLGARLPQTTPPQSSILLTSTEDWQGGELSGTTVRDGSLELQQSSGGEWQTIKAPVANYVDVLPLTATTVLLAVDLVPQVIYYDGCTHQEQLPVGAAVRCLAKTGQQVFAFSSEGKILERVGKAAGKWVMADTAVSINNPVATTYEGDEVVAVNSDGYIAHYKEGVWHQEQLPGAGSGLVVTRADTLADGTVVITAGSQLYTNTTNGRWQTLSGGPMAGDTPLLITGVAGENTGSLVVATTNQLYRRDDESRWTVDDNRASCPPPEGNLVTGGGGGLWYGASVGQSVRLVDGIWTTVPLPPGVQGITNLRVGDGVVWGIARQNMGAKVLMLEERVRYVEQGSAVFHLEQGQASLAELRYSKPVGTEVSVEHVGNHDVRITMTTTDEEKTPSVKCLTAPTVRP